jgi:ATP-dependent RNA helicase UAP56/SUB2
MLGIKKPSECIYKIMLVQKIILPYSLAGRDILCEAKSGQGKTLSYVISAINQIAELTEPDGVICLVVVHTRELVHNIACEFRRQISYLLPNLRSAMIYGGTPISSNIEMLKTEKPHIVVGTPGRTLSLIKNGNLDTTNVKILVIDDCDTLLNELGKYKL